MKKRNQLMTSYISPYPTKFDYIAPTLNYVGMFQEA